MANMLDYIDMLNELDTDGVEPMSHVFPVNNVFREDVVTNGDRQRSRRLPMHRSRRTAAIRCRKPLIRMTGGKTVDLMSLTAVELGKKIQAGEVSVREAAEASMAAY